MKIFGEVDKENSTGIHIHTHTPGTNKIGDSPVLNQNIVC